MVFRSTRPKVCKVPSAQWNLVSCGSSGCSIEYRCPKALKDPDSTVKNATFLRGHWAEIWPEHCTDGGSTFLTEEVGIKANRLGLVGDCGCLGRATWPCPAAGWSSKSGLAPSTFFFSWWRFHKHPAPNAPQDTSSSTTATVTINKGSMDEFGGATSFSVMRSTEFEVPGGISKLMGAFVVVEPPGHHGQLLGGTQRHVPQSR